GFDVAAPEERAQLQCLAESTGGTFFTAANAHELTVALREATSEALAPPEPVSLMAVDGSTGAAPPGEAEWTITDIETQGTRAETGPAAGFEIALAPGQYEARVEAGGLTGG